MTFDQATMNELYRYCYSLTSNEAVAFDLLQDGLERFLCRSGRQPIDNPVAYLRRLLRNQFIDQIRHQRRFPQQSLDDTHENALGIGLQVLENESIAAHDLAAIWTQLEPGEREILYLWAQQGMTAAEIATQTDTPRNTVLSRIHRLRQKLRRQFGDDGQGAEAG